VVPIRFSEDSTGNGQSLIGLGVHVGVGF
jgi:hypothetical protein